MSDRTISKSTILVAYGARRPDLQSINQQGRDVSRRYFATTDSFTDFATLVVEIL